MILCVGTTPAIQRVMRFGHLTPGAVNRAVETVVSVAGKSINVAKVVRALGEPSTALGVAGGEPGGFLRAELFSRGIARLLMEVDPPTRTCVTLIDDATSQVTELVEESRSIPPTIYDCLVDVIATRLRPGDGLVCSGTLTPNAPQDFYARCVAAARAVGAFSIVDAKGEPLKLAIAEKPTLLKPNAEELAQTLHVAIDDEKSLRAAAAELAIRSGAWVLVTRGAEPAIATDGTHHWSIAVPPLKPLNPIGSGDSVAAGIATVLARGGPMPDALRTGIAAGSANALTLLAGDVRREHIDHLLPHVHIRPETAP